MSLQGQFQSVRIVPVRGENAVVVSGPARYADQAAAAIRELDRAPALLTFDAEILEVNSDDMDSSGVDWQNGQGQPVLTLTLREIDPPIISGTPPSSDVFSARPCSERHVGSRGRIKLIHRRPERALWHGESIALQGVFLRLR